MFFLNLVWSIFVDVCSFKSTRCRSSLQREITTLHMRGVSGNSTPNNNEQHFSLFVVFFILVFLAVDMWVVAAEL